MDQSSNQDQSNQNKEADAGSDTILNAQADSADSADQSSQLGQASAPGQVANTSSGDLDGFLRDAIRSNAALDVNLLVSIPSGVTAQYGNSRIALAEALEQYAREMRDTNRPILITHERSIFGSSDPSFKLQWAWVQK